MEGQKDEWTDTDMNERARGWMKAMKHGLLGDENGETI